EPKVQIDPTLIEPRHGALPAPAGEPAAAISSPALPAYDGGTSRPAIEAPAIQMMMAVPQPGQFPPPHASPVPGYALDPSYPVMPVAMPPPSSPQLVVPGGFGDPRYASTTATALRAQTRRRQLIIMLASAVVAVLLGIAALLIVKTRHPSAPAPPPGKTVGGSGRPASAPTPVQPDGAAADQAAPTEPAHAATASPLAATPVAAAAASASQPGECFADVSSQPTGADIVLDQNVVGTTPQRVTLPCGHPVDLVIRKLHLASVVRTITPIPDGVPVKVTLSKQLSRVRVSSTPEGATVTLNGKPLGVTPTTVQVPAFESSALNITKDGYETETETVSPNANGGTVRTVLKRLERKKPR
ncbi:MAG TPA: PEGA domain-containing protein, partial [Kofleriaceae bacterium]